MVISGHNYDSDNSYLFITGRVRNGPGTGGGKLTSPLQAVVSGNPDSFTVVKTNPDKTWEYVYYTDNLPVDAGTYTIYAVSQPRTKDRLGSGRRQCRNYPEKTFYNRQRFPRQQFQKERPLSVSGSAEGNPEAVQIWILGKNYYSKFD